MPHLCFGGAERLASRLVDDLRNRGCPVTVAVIGRKPEEADATASWFGPVAHEILRFDSQPPGPLEPLARTIESRRPCFIAFIGRSTALHELPALCRRFPTLRFVSFQFNEHELTLEHRLYAQFLDLILVEGTVVAETLIAHGVCENRIAVVPSGVDLTQFRPVPAAPPSNPAAAPEVGFVGRMDPIKGPLAFVEIGRLLAGRHEARFVMAGDGPVARDTRRAIRKGGLAHRFEWLGRVDQAALPRLYARLAVLVVPSALDGRPLVVQEAQACGVPVVASRVGSIPELIEDGVTGLLCPPGDHDAFAQAVARLLEDAALRRQIGAAGQGKVVRDGGLAASLDGYATALLGGPGCLRGPA